MNLSFVNSRRFAHAPNVVSPPHMASPEPPAARPLVGVPPPSTADIEDVLAQQVELLEVRPTDTLLVPVSETWTPSQIRDFAQFLDAVLRERNVQVAGILPVPGGPGGSRRIQVLRQKEVA